jgi:hypothetical protein
MPFATEAARRWTLVATILGSSLTFIDDTVVNVAWPALQSHLYATITDVQWIALFGILLVRVFDTRPESCRVTCPVWLPEL